jgi:hypothetical protein
MPVYKTRKILILQTIYQVFLNQWIAGSVLIFSSLLQLAYADTIQEYTAKSVLTLNLARFVTWPPDTFTENNSTLNLCILGDDNIMQAFNLIEKKSVEDKILAIRSINQSKNLDNCQLVYVGSDSNLSSQFYDDSYKKHILTIGETDDFLSHGGMVFLEISAEKINIHVNIAATKKAGVQISSRVLKLATIYNP